MDCLTIFGFPDIRGILIEGGCEGGGPELLGATGIALMIGAGDIFGSIGITTGAATGAATGATDDMLLFGFVIFFIID